MRAVGGVAAHSRNGSADTAGEEVRSGLDPFELTVLALGFGLCHAWVVGFLSFAARFSLAGSGIFGYDQVYLFAGAFGAVAVACLVRGRTVREAIPRVTFGTLNLATAGVALLALGLAVATGLKPLTVGAFALCGISSAFLQMAWGMRFSRFPIGMALLSVPVGAMVTAVILMVLPHSSLLACLYVLPGLSLVLLHAHRMGGGSLVLSLREEAPGTQDAHPLATAAGEKGAGRDAGKAPHPQAREEGSACRPVSASTLVRLMASIAVFSLVGRCLDSFPAATVDIGVPDFIAQNYAFLAILAVGALLAVFALAFRERFDVMLVYRLSLPCMVAGFAVLTVFMDRFTVASVCVMTIGYEFFDLLFWILLVGLARQGEEPRSLFIFGWGVAMTYAGMGAGTLLSRAAVPPILAGTIDMSALSLMCILVLVVLVVLVLPEGVLAKVGASARPASKEENAAETEADTLEKHCGSVAARCDLTPRERDVLLLLARGRTLAVVARELNIAEGTARTHMMHIYSKLGVHRQQELIDMVEQERA